MHLVIRLCGAEILAVEVGDADPAALDDHDNLGGQVELAPGFVAGPWQHTAPDPADGRRRGPGT